MGKNMNKREETWNGDGHGQTDWRRIIQSHNAELLMNSKLDHMQPDDRIMVVSIQWSEKSQDNFLKTKGLSPINPNPILKVLYLII